MSFNLGGIFQSLLEISSRELSTDGVSGKPSTDRDFDDEVSKLFKSFESMTLKSSSQSEHVTMKEVIDDIRDGKLTEEEFSEIWESITFSQKETIISKIPNLALPQRRQRKRPEKRKHDNEDDSFTAKKLTIEK
jgi:hypothetical protein